jgi:hypothetical protein
LSRRINPVNLWQAPLLYLADHPGNKTWDSVGALLSKLRAN